MKEHILHLEKQLQETSKKLWHAWNVGNIELYEKYSKRMDNIKHAIKLLKESGM